MSSSPIPVTLGRGVGWGGGAYFTCKCFHQSGLLCLLIYTRVSKLKTPSHIHLLPMDFYVAYKLRTVLTYLLEDFPSSFS